MLGIAGVILNKRAGRKAPEKHLVVMIQVVSSSERDTALQLAEQRAKRLAQSLQESEAEVTSLAGRLQSSVSPADSARAPS